MIGKTRFIYCQSWDRKDVDFFLMYLLGFSGNFRVLFNLSVFVKAGKRCRHILPCY